MAKKRTKSQKRRTQPSQKTFQRHVHLSLQSERFIDRDLSWIEFNNRVLDQAMDESLPLLERLHFVSIFHSNLDEFIMKRMKLLRFIEMHTENEELEERVGLIRGHIQKGVTTSDQTYVQLLEKLKTYGVEIKKWADLNSTEKDKFKKIYRNRIFPILTPIAVDPGHPFPHISNLSTSLAVLLQSPQSPEKLFSRLKIPKVFPQLIPINSQSSSWIPVSEIIQNNLEDVFSKMEIKAVSPFRITRNIEMERDEEMADDLLAMIEHELKERRFGEVVRVEFPQSGDLWLKNFIKAELDLSEKDFYLRDSVLDYSMLEPLLRYPKKELKFSEWKPRLPWPRYEDPDTLFNALAKKDELVHHPYQSFSGTVESFIQMAVDDPKVIGIKMTLYRTNENSHLIKSLIRAAELNKQVVCIVELKARFDEERNISWAQALEEAGVHVIYGIVGLKTHGKVALVVRKSGERLKCFAHIGTGNYNSQTAKFYTDLGLFTANEQITEELVNFFHFLTGRSLHSDYKKLLVAPVNLKKNFLEMIERETDHVRKGGAGRIIIKCNNIEDPDIGEALYKASQGGVKIDLIVRSICTVRAGVKGLSDNIRVVSIVDRFLEHSRIFYFQNQASSPEQGEFYIGSSDLMYRNLHGRVEVITPILDQDCKNKLYECLTIILSEKINGWQLEPDGSYKRLAQRKEGLKSTQEQLMEYYSRRKNQSTLVDNIHPFTNHE